MHSISEFMDSCLQKSAVEGLQVVETSPLCFPCIIAFKPYKMAMNKTET